MEHECETAKWTEVRGFHARVGAWRCERPGRLDRLEEARRRDAPVRLSVGYAACHWCQ
ncbi:DUF255 domain-containing protein [Kitasatospora sp. NBC_01266]|uniref:DUF255 domain-containing protein n=1 Tax=Kitasatospora sp. NBC_01266 TaxID=2903572 RepID=UPI002E367901|nr:DUF255 domain-containing protein [Kitasatospora sp. NBC_01266]